MYHIFFIHSSIEWTSRLFLISRHYEKITNEHGLASEPVVGWVSFVYIPKSGIAVSLGKLIANFLRNCHTDFHTGCINLFSQQQRRSTCLVPYEQRELSFVVLILDTLNSIRWNLKVILSCISLMAKDVEHSLSAFGHLSILYWEFSV